MRHSAQSSRFLPTLAGMAALVAALMAAPANVDAAAAIADRLLVKPAKDVTEVQLHALLSAHGAKQMDSIPGLDVRVIQVPAKARDRVLLALRRNPKVQFAEKDFVAQAIATANDPYYASGSQWHLSKIQAPTAWDVTTGSPTTVIAVVDTGADYNHPDLQGKLLAGYDFVNGDHDASDDNGHGTGVSGAAAAASNNGTGIAGVAWQNAVLPVKALDAAGSGSYSSIAQSIRYAADRGARIINLSLGGTSSSLTLQSAVDYAWSKGAVLIAAAGNNGNNVPCYPAACKNVVAVSATTSSDTRPSWSNYGSYVDISAPGENILTTSHGAYYFVNGTSFSSPIAAGVAALMASVQPKLSNAEIVSLLGTNTDDIGALGYDVYYGQGRLNAAKAVIAARNAYSADTTAPVVTLDSPAEGSVVFGTVELSATATDNVSVTKMEFLIDGAIVAQSADGTLACPWNTLTAANGAHLVQVRACDAAGNVSVSSSSVTVQNVAALDEIPPSVTINSPSDGSTVAGMVQIRISGSDNVGVTRLELYIDGNFAGSSASSTATFNWNTKKIARGEHTLQAYGYDAAGNIGASTATRVRR